MRKFFRQVFSRRSIRLVITYCLIFVLAGFIGNIWMTRNQATGQLPSMVFKDIHGVDFKLQFNKADAPSQVSTIVLAENSIIQDKPVLLYFFADWCPICKVQHSVISTISPYVHVLGIAMQSGDDENVRNYVAEKGIGFTVVNDESGKLSRSLGVNGVPAAFILNKSGQIKYSTRGYTSTAGLLVRIWLTNNDLI